MKPVIKCNDNLIELRKIPDGSVDLVYIDPPFKTGKHQGDYDDRWKSIDDYITFMKPRMEEIHRVLKDTGSVFIHANKHAVHYLHVLADDMFGEKNFKNIISWKKNRLKNNTARMFSDDTEFILFYGMSDRATFNTQYHPLKDITLKRYNNDDRDGKGKYRWMTVDAPGGKKYSLDMGEKMPVRGYAYSREKMLGLHAAGEVFIKPGFVPRIKKYLSDSKGSPLTATWDDIGVIKRGESKEHVGYATQKPEKLLERVILSSSNPDDTVLDAFAGSGTTCAVAKKLGRKSICIDQNPKACKIMGERLR